MYKVKRWFSSQPKLIYYSLLLLSLISFNLILNDSLHLKMHHVGQRLVKQVYELNISLPVERKMIAALAQSQGFMLTPEKSSIHFKNLIQPEHNVFSYKSLNLSLYHYPIWLMEIHLFIFLNLIILGAIGSFYQWHKPFRSRGSGKPYIQLNTNTPAKMKVLAKPCTTKEQALDSSYAPAPMYNSLFVLIKCDCIFDKYTDIEASLNARIIKRFPEIKKITVELCSSGNLAVTFYNILVSELDSYMERLHKTIVIEYQKRQSKSVGNNIKLGGCNYRLGAAHEKVYQLANSALALSETSLLLHRHRLALSNNHDVIFCANQVINNIKKNKFMLSFQPLFDLVSGDILQHEALIRVRHDTHGLLAAQYFINQVNSVEDAFVLDKSFLKQIITLVIAEKSPLRVSVNIHPKNWLNNEFWQWLVKCMNDLTLCSNLQFEINENYFYIHYNALIEVFELIKKHRSHIIITNVTKSENIHNLINHEEVCGLKLAYELVHLINEKSANRQLIRDIVNAGKLLNLPVYAVGVETQKELAILTKLGVAGAQGAYFSEPLQELTEAAFH